MKTFLISLKLRNAYKVNTFIYALKSLPILNKILSTKLYQSKIVKIIGNIISILWEIINIFIGKFLYIYFMVWSVTNFYELDKGSTFLHILFFLTIIGAFLNTYMFNASKDKYYALFMLRMNAYSYTLSNYFYNIIKVVIGFLPFIIIIGLYLKINIFILLLIPVFIASIKLIVAACFLYLYEKKGIFVNENKPLKNIWILTIICLLFAYALPYIHIIIPSIFLIITMIIIILISIPAIIYIIKFTKYREIYKLVFYTSNMNAEVNQTKIQIDTSLKQISFDNKYKSNKKGYAYFNDLFVKRHSKLLMKSSKKVAFISLCLIIGTMMILFFNPNISNSVNNILMEYLPYFVFVMYLINRGENVTKTMFINSDHAMLTYSFYREPKAILGLFKERLKSIIIINLIPASIIGIGLALLLAISGGTDNYLNYFILITSILAMSILFSIHHLVLYYLLQPYNINSETKNATYTLANVITYIACYYMIDLQLPTLYFGCATILFALIYSFVSLFLVYKLAPKTFKIRI